MSMKVRVFGHMLFYVHDSVLDQQLVHEHDITSIRSEGISWA